jgi:transcriptional regulator
MYVPKHFEQSDPDLLLEVMRKYNFATLVSLVDGEYFATHVPVLARHVDGAIEISGHVARANAHWRAWQDAPQAMMIFQGPHTYISPTLYAGRNRVPTWNYIAVHASGSVRVDESEDGKLATLQHLITHHEPGYRQQFSDLDTNIREGLLRAIVGFTLRVERLEGKFKLGQHRLAEDSPDMQAWHEAGGEDTRELASWMKRLGYWT